MTPRVIFKWPHRSEVLAPTVARTKALRCLLLDLKAHTPTVFKSVFAPKRQTNKSYDYSTLSAVMQIDSVAAIISCPRWCQTIKFSSREHARELQMHAGL